MRFAFSKICLVCLVLVVAPFAFGQMSSNDAQRLGLEVAWSSQVELPRAGGVASAHLWAEKTNPRKFAVVTLPSRTIRISADEVDRDGNPIGIDGAKKKVSQVAAKLIGKPTGFEVVELTIPRIKLITITRNGVVQAVDGESGQVLWSNTCGDTTAPAFPGAVSEAGVVVVHGEYLYVLNLETGKHDSVRRLNYATSNAVAATNNTAFVIDQNGRVEAYPIGSGNFVQRWGYAMLGRAIGHSLSLLDDDLCAIDSNKGYLYVFNSTGEPSVWMRYQSSTPIVGCITTGNDALYAGNLAGKLVKIIAQERIGRIEWEFLSGQALSAPPLVIGPNVFVAADNGTFYQINDADGTTRWSRRGLNIEEPLAVIGKNVFARDQANQYIAFDIETGRTIGQSSAASFGTPITNHINDRLYLLGRHGELQCLRELGAELPTMVTPFKVEEAKPEPAKPAQEATPQMQESNPFGGGANPFGAAPEPDANMANPFGGADPLTPNN